MKRLVTTSIITLLLVGCNAILNNEPGTLESTDETPNEPTAPTTPMPGSSSSGGADEDAGGVPISGDAGQPTTPPDAGGCPTGQMLCNNACVSITDPLYGCGSATCAPCKLAHAGAACASNVCVVAQCDPGYADCNKNPADGCEVDLSKPATCGACNAACPPTAPVCGPSGTTFACSTGCTPTAPLLCGAECVDPATSVNHCGACNAKCADVPNGTTACTGGACTFTCKAGYHKCGAACAVATDPAACGPTCAVCPTPPNATPACTNDACTFTCKAGFADCNMSPVDGCESTLATDPANCGLCGRVGPAGSTCVAGACTAPPPPADGGAPPP